MSEKHRCEAHVFRDRFSHACRSWGKYKEGGKWYCGHHRPSKREAYAEKRSRQWEAEWAYRDRGYKLQDRIERLEQRIIKACYELRGTLNARTCDKIDNKIDDLVDKHEKAVKALERHEQKGIPQVS